METGGNMTRMLTTAVAVAAALAAGAAQAQQLAFVSVAVEMRAGPDIGYPVVFALASGTPVHVQGCTQDYAWCDVTAGPQRGWVYGALLNYQYQAAYQPLSMVGPAVGIPVMAFVLGDYWGRHYRERSWYNDRNYWERHPPKYNYGHGHGHNQNKPRPPKPGQLPTTELDSRPPKQVAAPVGGRSNANSGWDRNNPNAERPDKP
jgi:uncharacterized protein YraI